MFFVICLLLFTNVFSAAINKEKIKDVANLSAFEGKWIRICHKGTDLCLTQAGSNESTIIQTVLNKKDNSSLWKLTKISNAYVVKSFIGNYVLDNYGAIIQNGNKLIGWAQHNGDNQKWIFNVFDAQSYQIHLSQGNGKMCIDVPAGNKNPISVLQLWECQNGNTNQAFKILIAEPEDLFLPGKVYRIKSKVSEKCLKPSGGNGADIIQSICLGKDNSLLWKSTKNPAGGYILQSVLGNYVIDVFGAGVNNGNRIIGWPQHGGANQVWFIHSYDSSDFYLREEHSNKCLDVPGGTNQSLAKMQLWDCYANDSNQAWTFEEGNEVAQFDAKKWYKIRGNISNKCLMQTLNDGQQLLQGICSDIDNSQLWSITSQTDGTYIIKSFIGNYVFDVLNSAQNNGNAVIGWPVHGGDNQRWFINNWDSHYFFIKDKNSAKCLDIPGGTNEPLKGMQIWDCTPENRNQAWEMIEGTPSTLDGKEVHIVSKLTNKCLNFSDSPIKQGNKITEEECEKKNSQVWTLSKVVDGSYTIQSKLGNFVFDVLGFNKNNGGKIIGYPKHNENNQRWFVFSWDQSSFYLRSPDSKKCIDIPGGQSNSGTEIQIWDCEPLNSNQAFIFSTSFAENKIKISGFLKDSSNDQDIQTTEGSVITFTNGGQTVSARIVGNTYIVELPTPGKWTIDFKVIGYAHENVISTFNQSSDVSNVRNTKYLSPIIKGYRLVVVWNDVIQDLDAHLLLPDGTEIKYNNRVSADGKITLDVDHRRGNGPETISLKDVSDGVYKYFVDNYSKEGPFLASQATAYIYKDDKLIHQIRVTSEIKPVSDNIWYVGDLNAKTGKFTVINKVQNSKP